MSRTPWPSPLGDGQSAELSDLEGLSALGDAEFGALRLLCRSLHIADADLDGTLQAILVAATAAIRGADEAGLNLLNSGRFEPQATLGAAPPELDALQQRTRGGPCIDASRDQVSIVVDDFSAEKRWPDFAATAVRIGIHAMMCVPLWVDERRLGSLSLYARAEAGFDATAQRLADLYATQGAVALLEAQRTDQLQRAIASRDIIGQAKGVLMERRRIPAEQAFQILKSISQRANVKIGVVAEMLATTGELPSLDGLTSP